MNKAIFLDRDGTINVDFGYVYKTQELELLPGVAEALRIFQELGYLLIVITNQSGIGRGYFTLEDAEQFNRALAQELEKHGVILNDFYTCPHAPEEHCECRKPSPFMVTEAMKKYDIDPSQSYMFGDKKSDTECSMLEYKLEEAQAENQKLSKKLDDVVTQKGMPIGGR